MKRINQPNINTPNYWNGVYKKGLDPEIVKMDEFKFKIIAHHLVDGTKVLDLGCGTGELCKIISEERPYCIVWGVDFSEEAIKKASELNKDNKFIVRDITKTDFFDKEFDYVVSCEILEHLEEPEKLIKEASRLLKPGGIFILTTPFGNHIPSLEHIWEFDYADIENMLVRWFKDFWVFPWVAGWTEVRETKSQMLIYPKGHWDTIMAIAIR